MIQGTYSECFKAVSLSVILLISLLFSCSDDNQNGNPVLVYASPSDFQDTANVSIQVAEGFNISLWAPGPLLSNAVSISIDHQGAAYVSSTQRRKSSDLDIRSHREWMAEDLALQTLEDTEAFHLNKLAIENSDQNSWLEDFDGNVDDAVAFFNIRHGPGSVFRSECSLSLPLVGSEA